MAGASSVTEEPVMSHDQMRDRMRRIHSCVFGCEVDALTAVPDEARLAGGGQGLDDYMTLPVDQYASSPTALSTALSLSRENNNRRCCSLLWAGRVR